MAFGLSPKHEQTYELNGLSSGAFIVIALEAVKQLEWNPGHVSENGLIAYTKISMSSYGEELKIVINGDIAIIKSECTGSQLLDLGKNKTNVENFISTFDQIKNSISPDELSEKISAIKKDLIPADKDILNQALLNKKEKISGFLAIFKPTRGFFITPILINLNILIFIIMVISGVNFFSPGGEDLLNWGANFKPSTLNGEWWRLFTCCFLHIGVLHLLMNMYALLYIGLLLEPMLGRARFLSAYLVTGIAASLTSLLWNDLIISAGASGAIFGMYGVFFALLTTNHIEKSARRSLLTSIAVFIGYNLLNGMKGGIDNAAHIGGLLSGLITGYVFYPGLKETGSKRTENAGIASVSIAIIIAVIVILSNTSNDLAKYDSRIKDFAPLEEKALAVYKAPADTPNEKLLYLLNNEGIKNWQACIALITDLQKLDLPETIQDKNMLLKYYCELRIKCYKLIDKAISENTEQYRSQIDSCNSEIEKAIQDLSAK